MYRIRRPYHRGKHAYKRYQPANVKKRLQSPNKWIFIGVLGVVILLSVIFSSANKDVRPPRGVQDVTLIGITASPQNTAAAALSASTADVTIDVYDTKAGAIKTMNLEDYITCVVPAEVPVSFEPEALKAQAVAARTYAFRKMIRNGGGGCSQHPGADVCTSSSSCQAYISLERRKTDWGGKFNEYEERIREAVDGTRGQIVVYDGKPIQAFFHSTSGGMTEDSENVFSEQLPYCRAVESPGEENGLRYEVEKTFSIHDFVRTIRDKYPETNVSDENLKDNFKILSRYKSGRVEELEVGKINLSGIQLRTLFKLDSANFDIQISGNDITLKTHGFGHGVGLSQEGANAMAKKGSDSVTILKHYYQGVDIDIVDHYLR